MANKNIFTIGGTVQAGEGIYIPRQADDQLLEFCREGAFSYILTPRQMGKSSLMLRTAERLKTEGILSVTIDLQQLGTELNAEQWYLGILTRIEDALSLETDVLQWWSEKQHLGMTHRLTQFFQKVLLKERSEQIIIFIDEIDTTLSLGFTDDFFIAIRYLYSARADIPEFKRLSFVLIGVATPGDLIADPQRTPFNIGRRVDLSDFSLKEAKPLTAGFELPRDKADQVLEWIMSWTGGHPYLTQRLCYAIAAEDGRDWTEQDIDAAVARTFFDVTSEEDHNLQFVRDMLTKRAPQGLERDTLLTYRDVYQNKKPVMDEEQSIVKNHLKLSGIVKRENRKLQLRNAIYRDVFSLYWIIEHLPVDWKKRIKRVLFFLIIILTPILVTLSIFTFKSRQEAVALKNIAERQRKEADSLRKVAEDSAKSAQFQREFAILEKERADQKAREALEEKIISDSLRSDAEAAEEKFRQQYLRANYNLVKLFEEKAGKALADASKTKNNSDYQQVWLYSLAALNQEIAADRSLPIPMSHYLLSPKIQTEAFAQLWSSSFVYPAPRCVAFSPDGTRLASASEDNSIRLWDAASGAALATLAGHTRSVLSVAFSPDGKRLASGSDDNSIRLWDAASGAALATLAGHTGWVMSVAFSPDGNQLASGSDDGSIRLWDAASGAALATLSGHTDWVRSVAFSPDGNRLASGSFDNSIRLWDAASGAALATLSGHERSMNSVAFSPDGNRLASGSDDGSIRLWDAASGTALATLSGHTDWVRSVAFSPDGKRLASGSGDRSIRLWDAKSGVLLIVLSGHKNSVYSVAFSPDGKQLASGSWDKSIRLWDAASGVLLATLLGHTDGVNSVSFSPDCKRLASGYRDRSIRLWDAASGVLLATLLGHTDGVTCVAFSPNGKRLASGSGDRSVRLWDTSSGALLATLAGHEGWVYSVSFSPDGKRLASGSWDKSIRLWDAESGVLLATIAGHKGWVNSVAFSPDGKRLASGSDDRSIRLWDAVSGVLLATLSGHENSVHSVAFSPNGKWLASGSDDRSIRLWDTASGTALTTLSGHTYGVSSVAFSPDGTRLASGSWDRSIRLWDLNDELLIGYSETRREAAAFKALYQLSYFLLPYRLQELDLIDATPFSLKEPPPLKPAVIQRLMRPRPVDKNPIEWLLECAKE